MILRFALFWSSQCATGVQQRAHSLTIALPSSTHTCSGYKNRCFHIQFGGDAKRERNLVLLAETERQRDEWLQVLQDFANRRERRRTVVTERPLPVSECGLQSVASLVQHTSDEASAAGVAPLPRLEKIRGVLSAVSLRTFMKSVNAPAMSPIFDNPTEIGAKYPPGARDAPVRRAQFVNAVASLGASNDAAGGAVASAASSAAVFADAAALWEHVALAVGFPRNAPAMPRSSIVAAVSIVCVADAEAVALAVFACFEQSVTREDRVQLEGLVACLEIAVGASVRFTPNAAIAFAAEGRTVADCAKGLARKAFRDAGVALDGAMSFAQFERWLKKNYCRRPHPNPPPPSAVSISVPALDALHSAPMLPRFVTTAPTAAPAAAPWVATTPVTRPPPTPAAPVTPITPSSKPAGRATLNSFAEKQQRKAERMKEMMAKMAADRAAAASGQGAALPPLPSTPSSFPAAMDSLTPLTPPPPPPPPSFPSGRRNQSIMAMNK